MRLILIGCEYVGKTTSANALEKWGSERGRHFHMDDHFTIPDEFFLDEDAQKAMLKMPPVIKERFQRFQIYYHLGVLEHYEDAILVGCHIEEAIYGPRYYYPGSRDITYQRRIESQMPLDTILVLLTANPDVIRARMTTAPHRYSLVQPSEVEEIQEQFETEFTASQIRRKVRFDTSDLRPEEVLGRFLKAVRPNLNVRDLLLTS